jgi:putative spermidine/putrescine transport system ATP-binding protein
MVAAIEFRGVSRVFGEVRAVDDVSFAIEPGEFFAMLGPSGSGKTSCLRLVAGFDTPDRGQVLLDGADVSSVPPYDRNVNTVFQDYALFPHMNVLQNVAYGPRVRGVGLADREQRAREMLELVQLSAQGERRPAQLSGGQRQRVAIARAILANPRVLILDEATSSLDSESEALIQDGLRSLRQGRTTFVIAHRLSTIRSADQIMVLEHGEIVEHGTHDELLARGGRYRQLYDKQYRFERDRFINPGEDFTPEPEKVAATARASTAL